MDDFPSTSPIPSSLTGPSEYGLLSSLAPPTENKNKLCGYGIMELFWSYYETTSRHCFRSFIISHLILYENFEIFKKYLEIIFAIQPAI